MVTVPAGAAGMFMGGYAVKRWGLRVKGIIVLCISVNAIVLCCFFALLFRCPVPRFAGVTAYYDGSTIPRYDQYFNETDSGSDIRSFNVAETMF